VEDLRPTSDVFRQSATSNNEAFRSRFASSGKFEKEELESGAELQEQSAQQADDPEFDPDDKRSLYDRLKEQKDAKQEEWEHKHTFKNQMDHWKLDEDEAAFEEERQERDKQQRLEAARLHDESSQFYHLARASQERTIEAKPPPASAASLARASEKRKPQQPPHRLACVKVMKAAPKEVASAPVVASPAPAPATLLPGMAAYDDDSGSEDDDS